MDLDRVWRRARLVQRVADLESGHQAGWAGDPADPFGADPAGADSDPYGDPDGDPYGADA